MIRLEHYTVWATNHPLSNDKRKYQNSDIIAANSQNLMNSDVNVNAIRSTGTTMVISSKIFDEKRQ